MTKKTPLLSAPTGVTAEEKGASLKLKGRILSEINGAIMPQASFWKAATVSGETTRTPRHLGSQTAFDFEILSALAVNRETTFAGENGPYCHTAASLRLRGL